MAEILNNRGPESMPAPQSPEAGSNESVDLGFDAMGNVAEVVPDIRENASEQIKTSKQSGQKSAVKKAEPMSVAQIKAQLLKQMPSEEVVLRQVEREIKKEIDFLQKKAMKMIKSPGKMSYFEMANLMKKVRELKGLLATLVKASLDNLKTLWLRFVHGIM